jgi:type III secretory pathway component EscS
MSSDSILKEIVNLMMLTVALLALSSLLLLILFSSIQQSQEYGIRFFWGMLNMFLPTTFIAAIVDIVLAVVGGVSITSDNLKFPLKVLFALYFTVNYISGWITAPV